MNALEKIKDGLEFLHNVKFGDQNVAKIKSPIGLAEGFDFRPELRITKLSGGYEVCVWVGDRRVGTCCYYDDDAHFIGTDLEKNNI